jgi:NAD(P)-dependent dehydrogenase (short-subunit alcohol dehydrogenase family)
MGILLAGQIALVTGAGRGIGEAIALKFASEGADLVLAARTESQLGEVKRKIEGLGRRAIVVPTDMADREQAIGLAKKAEKEFGRVDIVVSNAGTSAAVPLADVQPDVWREIQATNLEGPLAMLQALARGMIERRSGNIIFISSIRGTSGVPYGGPYAASKAAINSVTKTLACEWGPQGIRVNAILPGPVDTDMVRAFFKGNKKLYDYYGNLAPLRRWTLADDCAGPALFLASDMSGAVTGHCLVVDGGLTAMLQDSFAPPPEFLAPDSQFS